MKSGDWRREILGDITVMNAEEVELFFPEFDQHITYKMDDFIVSHTIVRFFPMKVSAL